VPLLAAIQPSFVRAVCVDALVRICAGGRSAMVVPTATVIASSAALVPTNALVLTSLITLRVVGDSETIRTLVISLSLRENYSGRSHVCEAMGPFNLG